MWVVVRSRVGPPTRHAEISSWPLLFGKAEMIIGVILQYYRVPQRKHLWYLSWASAARRKGHVLHLFAHVTHLNDEPTIAAGLLAMMLVPQLGVQDPCAPPTGIW